jgi:prepilin-type N-terminal cleavage/methylation domain-containing protein
MVKERNVMKNQLHPKFRAGFTLIEIMIVVAIIGLLAAMAIPNLMNSVTKAKRTTCITNIRNIDGAKQQWNVEVKAAVSSTPTPSDIQHFLGRGTAGNLPTCPSDQAATFATSYSINDLQTLPVCLIQPGMPGDTSGHRLD